MTVITTDHGDRKSGMTASAVSSLSLDPVLLLVCINNRLPAHEAIEGSRRFVVNVLGEGQQDLALHFARPSADKFAGIALRDDHELPVLDDAIAYFVCDVHERFPGGDHSIFTGLVRECGAKPGRRPLLVFPQRLRLDPRCARGRARRGRALVRRLGGIARRRAVRRPADPLNPAGVSHSRAISAKLSRVKRWDLRSLAPPRRSRRRASPDRTRRACRGTATRCRACCSRLPNAARS